MGNEFNIKHGFISKDNSIVNGSLTATTFYGDGSNLTGIVTDNFYVTGGTYGSGSLTLDRNDGNSVIVTGFTSGGGDNFYVTGGTVSGTDLILYRNGGLSDITIDTSSYFDNTDRFVTGATMNGNILELSRSGGLSDVTVDLSQFIDNTNYYVTGFTYNDANVFTLSRNGGLGDLSVTADTMENLTITDTFTSERFTILNVVTASTISQLDYIDFNTTYTPTQQEGRLHWDSDFGTLDVDLEGNTTHLKVGLDNLYYIKNQSGTTIEKGKVVRAAGTLGNSGRLLGEYMVADGSIPFYFTLGIAGEDILDGEDGYVYEFGLIKGVDTTGSDYSETWSGGTILYVHPTIHGGLTSVEPTEPNLKIQMAIVINAASNGSLFVRPDLSRNLSDLHNVQTTGETEGDLISYNSSQGYWSYTKDLVGDYTVSGSLSASTISAGTINATTYNNLPVDPNYYVTGATYLDGVYTFNRNDGNSFNVQGGSNYSAGVIEGSSGWTATGTGQIKLPEVKVALYDNSRNIEPLRVYTVSSGTTGVSGIPSLTNEDTNYVVIDYNGGSPTWDVLTNYDTINDSSIILAYTIYRLNNFIHVLDFGDFGAGLPNKLNDRILLTERFKRESGLSLGLSGSTGIVTLTEGVAWNASNRESIAAVNSQDDIFFKNYHVGGNWVTTTTGNTINNTFYDDGTDLVTATGGKYLVNWYFRGQEVNDHLYEVYGTSQYDSVADAELSTEPALPELITSHAFLTGRIIVGVGQNTGYTQSAFVTTFQSTNIQDHNDLTGLQGGTAGEYYHLTASQLNNNAYTNTNNNFSTDQTINGGLTTTGNMGIGTTTPTNILEVVQNTENFKLDLDDTLGPEVVLSTPQTDKYSRFLVSDGVNILTMGTLGFDWTGSTVYGNPGDSSIYSNTSANGVNIISAPGTGTEDYIRLYAGGNPFTSIASIHIQGSGSTKGYVGIGTETPQVELHVKGNSSILRLETTSATNNNYVEFWDPTERKGFLGYVSTANIDALFIRNEEHDADIIISTTNSGGTSLTAINIDGNQNVELPNGNLDVSGTLNIGTIGGGTPVGNLGFDSNGQVVTGTTGGAGGGEANTASNLGGGIGLFGQKSGVDLQFKSLTSTGNTITITSDSNTVNVEVKDIVNNANKIFSWYMNVT
jgi:hypothetical protein